MNDGDDRRGEGKDEQDPKPIMIINTVNANIYIGVIRWRNDQKQKR
jgi:hypothetical protein